MTYIMKTNRLPLFILLVIFFTYNSCKKDDATEENSTSNASQYFGNTVSITAKGRIIDANGNGIAGAIVKGGSSLDTTDIMGVFQLSSFAAHENLGCVTVEKPGFFKGVRSFVPKSGGNELLIRLLTKSNSGTINSVNGGTVTAPNIKLTLPANGVQLNNAAYNGTVNVAIKHINPTSPTFFEEMPGSLVGITNDQPYFLKSYGMVEVELSDNNGQKLQIAKGKTAEVRFEVPADLLSSAPATIDLWSLDEVNGYWKNEGTATLVNNEYVAQVSHFSAWNCDVPTKYINVSGQVINSLTQKPIVGAVVTTLSSFGLVNSNITNCNGEFNCLARLNDIVMMTVYVYCGGSSTNVFSNNIGPFTTDISLGTIAVTPSSMTEISGTVLDCNNHPLADSYVGINGQVIFPTNGVFSVLTCASSAIITPYGINPWIGEQPQLLTLTGGTQNVVLTVCGGAGAQGSVTDIDGNTYNTIEIGSQIWMQENLKTTRYKNGTVIPTGLSNTAWQTTTTGACSDYNNDTANTAVYGKLYNWYAVADPAGLCPAGWHEPEDWEWNVLVKYIYPSADTNCISCSQSAFAGGAMKEIGLTHWAFPNTGATNLSGFTSLPGGLRSVNGSYNSIGNYGNWWTASGYSATEAYQRFQLYNNSNIYRYYDYKSNGYSVRCVKD
jgi:uncharacterized protein (TIGR02145 family)